MPLFSRSISKDALELLSDQEKLHLNRDFSRFGRFYPAPVLAGFAAYVAIAYFYPAVSNAAFVGFIFFFLFFSCFLSPSA
nr:hypothetical protein [Desulfobacula sp.]